MSDEPSVQNLLRQGIEAARAGDRDRARELFEQVVELDDQNEKAWFWMASVVNTDAEKRASLNNVLFINPNNERARAALEKIGGASDDDGEDEIIPGVTRRQLMIFGGGGVALVVVILLVVAVIIAVNSGRRRAAENLQTQIAFEGTQGALLPTTQAAILTETQFALATPTTTPTDSPLANAPTLPPSWTPTDVAESADVAAAEVLDAPPLDVPGEIVAWSGRDVQNIGFLPVVIFPANQLSTEGTQVGVELARETAFNGNGSRIGYTRYFPTTFDFGIELINPNGTVPEDPGAYWRSTDLLLEVQDPSLSDDGCILAFTALPSDVISNQLYILNLCAAQAEADEEPSEEGEAPAGENDDPADNPFLSRISSDEAFYSDAVISGDGSQIAVIRDDRNSATPGVDLIVIDVVTGQITAITNDFGAFIESSPDWSPDSTQVVYAAAPSTSPDDNDVFIKQANGSGVAIPVVRGETNDTHPVYGPGGQYVAFASSRAGSSEIYIQDINSQAIFQVTNTGEATFPGDWKE